MQHHSLFDTHIICAPLPSEKKQIETVFEVPARDLSVSWYGTLNVLEEMPRAIENVCLEIDFKDLDSKHRFRTKLRSARCSFPNLKTIVAPKTGPLHHHDLLVEEGISVILTQSYSTTSSPRRPTPIGWPCRNIQWGLWEVSRDTPKQQVRIGNFLSCMTRMRQRPGALRVWDTASQAGTYDHRKFVRATRRIHTLVSKKSVNVISLDQLPEFISGGNSREVPTSILKAA